MSARYPIVAITGSSGAGTTSVTEIFQHIFRREGIRAQIFEGDSMHRFDRQAMRAEIQRQAELGNPSFSDFGPEANLLKELEETFAKFAQTGTGRVRRYIHDDAGAAESGCEPGTFTAWQDMTSPVDLLFYEGLHGGYVGPQVNVARHVDLLVGVAPIINLEWIQKLLRDKTTRGYSQEAVVDTILRRMPDYINHIVPQFSRTHVNFQRVPTVDTSNPFMIRDIPTPDESFVIIHFRKGAREKWGIDFTYLLDMIHDSFMSSPTSIVVNGGKMGFAMELILTPIIHRMIEEKKKLS